MPLHSSLDLITAAQFQYEKMAVKTAFEKRYPTLIS